MQLQSNLRSWNDAKVKLSMPPNRFLLPITEKLAISKLVEGRFKIYHEILPITVNVKLSFLEYLDYPGEKVRKICLSLARIMSNIGGYSIAVGYLLQECEIRPALGSSDLRAMNRTKVSWTN